MFYQAEWNNVNADSWRFKDANVVCRQLGYVRATNVSLLGYDGQGSRQTTYVIDCTGSESKLTDCRLNVWRGERRKDAAIICGNGDYSNYNSICKQDFLLLSQRLYF